MSVVAALFALACSEEAKPVPLTPDLSTLEPSFSEHVAPLIYAKCTPCHRSGGSAPFALTSYEETKRKARQIRIVTEERTMPPWLPSDGARAFSNDRSLQPQEIELLSRWVEAGAPQGDPERTPAPLHELFGGIDSGWRLGKPSIEVEMEPFVVPAEGRDVYRNFVIRNPVQRDTWVRTVEFQPDNPRVLHHAVMFVDTTGVARAEDARDAEPGYTGMDIGNLRIPDGQFITWLPGREPAPGEDDIAFLLRPDTDIVLQLHLRPYGRPETIQVRLGLFEAKQKPTRFPMTIRLWTRDIDIAAGDADYLVEAAYRLPVDIVVRAVYPHAHYVAHDLQGFAQAPGQERMRLIHIPDWDFNWQEEYFYEEPLALPKGTELSLRYVYDNSAENPRNPFAPPRRIVHGFESSDEMGELLFSVLPSERDRPVLWRDFERFALARDLANIEKHAAQDPGDPSWHHEIARYCLRLGRTQEAVRQYELLCKAVPDRPRPLQRLGQARLADGDVEGALRDLSRALELDPGLGRARLYYAQALAQAGAQDEAFEAYQEVLDRDPSQPTALSRLGEIHLARGEAKRARELFERALKRNPVFDRALLGLGNQALAGSSPNEAASLARNILHEEPAHAAGHHLLGRALAAQGGSDEALWHLELAVLFDPDEVSFTQELARYREQLRAANR